MEIADFAEITYGLLDTTPLRDFRPVVCLVDRYHIAALEGVPKDKEDEVREIGLRWAESKAKEGEEFLLVFRDGPAHFRIIRRVDGKLHEALFPERRPA
jgi:hypothetical protein